MLVPPWWAQVVPFCSILLASCCILALRWLCDRFLIDFWCQLGPNLLQIWVQIGTQMRSKSHVKLHLILHCFFDFFWSVLGRFSVSAWIENGRKIHSKIASQTKNKQNKKYAFRLGRAEWIITSALLCWLKNHSKIDPTCCNKQLENWCPNWLDVWSNSPLILVLLGSQVGSKMHQKSNQQLIKKLAKKCIDFWWLWGAIWRPSWPQVGGSWDHLGLQNPPKCSDWLWHFSLFGHLGSKLGGQGVVLAPRYDFVKNLGAILLSTWPNIGKKSPKSLQFGAKMTPTCYYDPTSFQLGSVSPWHSTRSRDARTAQPIANNKKQEEEVLTNRRRCRTLSHDAHNTYLAQCVARALICNSSKHPSIARPLWHNPTWPTTCYYDPTSFQLGPAECAKRLNKKVRGWGDPNM